MLNVISMDMRIEVSRILAEAEQKLSELTAEALRKKDYGTVQWLSIVTQRVAARDIVDHFAGDAGGNDSTDSSTSKVRRLESNHNSGQAPQVAAKQIDYSAGSKMFPQFYRDVDQLVKIGYSKSERRTYEHRSPREVLDRLAVLLVEIGNKEQPFTTEQILDLFQLQTPVVPTYQIYLCLAFLVRQGLVRRRGRSDYSTDNHAGDFSAAVKAAWDTLTSR